MKELNEIENKIQMLKNKLYQRRVSGRTTKMLENTIQDTLHGKSGDYFLVISHTSDWGRDMMVRMSKRLNELNILFSQKAGNALEMNNGAVVLFRTEHWWSEPRNKMSIKPINVYCDNVLSDISLEKQIKFLESELVIKV